MRFRPLSSRRYMMFMPAESQHASSVEMVSIDPHDLQKAQDRDAEDPAGVGGNAPAQVATVREKD